MDIFEKAYASGIEEVLNANGFTKKASSNIARVTTRLKKQASLFNFGDSQGGGISLSSILIPLLAAGVTGYVGYNAGMQGSKRRSAFTNIKNYLGKNLSKIVPDKKQPSLLAINN